LSRRQSRSADAGPNEKCGIPEFSLC
jgi:hypothetical protein